MAAKLKKRALAEFHSGSASMASSASMEAHATLGVASAAYPKKKLRLSAHPHRSHAALGHAGATSRAAAAALADWFPWEGGGGGGGSHTAPPLKTREVSSLLVQFRPKIKLLDKEEALEAAKRLCHAMQAQAAIPTQATDADAVNADSTVTTMEASVRVQMVLVLEALLDHHASSPADEVCALVRENADHWLRHWIRQEKSRKVAAALLTFVAKFSLRWGLGAATTRLDLFELVEEKLRDYDHVVRIGALRLLASCVGVDAHDATLNGRVLTLTGQYTRSSEPRVRQAAFETLHQIHRHSGHRLNVSLYPLFQQALEDDFDGVRQIALRLVNLLANTYPDERVKVNGEIRGGGGGGGDGGDLRLADDAFGKICNAMNDLCVKVRELAAELIGSMNKVSQEFLEQTLDKKLMSNMRLKKSAHERQSKLVASGEWSSGKKWADDSPKEKLDADTVNLMSFGACGAFVHGLEDEFLSVRSMSIESLTKLSIQNAQLAALALDFLVDMFNDEIELVRLKAIESLRLIAGHSSLSLQVHQLETILSALDDYSLVVREKLHQMLQASTLATKDALQKVISKLLENLKKYPQDKRSILMTFKRLGESHSELTLPLVTQLLEIHPFFDTAEPDIDEPAYLCILVLVFNAAQHCPTLEPLLDQHTKRHYHYLVDTYPHLIPDSSHRQVSSLPCNKKTAQQQQQHTNSTEKFLRQTLVRISDSEHLTLTNRIQLLERASEDLKRLASIEPSMSDSAHFVHLYLQAQTLFLKCLTTRFWCNPQALSAPQTEIIANHISTLFGLCLQLRHRFSQLSERQSRQIRVLKLHLLALHLVFLVRASNKSALTATEMFLSEANLISEPDLAESTFALNVMDRLSQAETDFKPGTVVRLIQPLLLSHPPQSLVFHRGVRRAHAVIYEPTGMNETPLKYTAGMILAVPVDCELFNVDERNMIRLAIKTPDQKTQLVTPKAAHFFPKENDDSCCRLRTEALMSHQVWSEALHVEISLVLDLAAAAAAEAEAAGAGAGAGVEAKKRSSVGTADDKRMVHLCEPVKVSVLPKAIKRGI